MDPTGFIGSELSIHIRKIMLNPAVRVHREAGRMRSIKAVLQRNLGEYFPYFGI